MPSGSVMPSPNFQALQDGAAVPFALLYTYRAGTLILEPTYQDADLTVANTNPVQCDSEGKAVVFLSPTSYKFNLTDADGNIIDPYPIDNIAATALSSSQLGAYQQMGGDQNSPVTATSYPSGSGYSTCHVGTTLWEEDSANLEGTYQLRGMVRGVGGTVTIALVNLSDGAPDTPIATISSSDADGELVSSADIVFPAAGATKTYGIKAKVSGGAGYGFMLEIVRVE